MTPRSSEGESWRTWRWSQEAFETHFDDVESRGLPGEYAVSVNALADVSVDDLAKRAARTNAMIMASTVGHLEAAGYVVEETPGRRQEDAHHDVYLAGAICVDDLATLNALHDVGAVAAPTRHNLGVDRAVGRASEHPGPGPRRHPEDGLVHASPHPRGQWRPGPSRRSLGPSRSMRPTSAVVRRTCTSTSVAAADVQAFFKKIDRQVPRRYDVHVILDNLSAHVTPEVTDGLDEPGQARWLMHFTPTSLSWLNLVERWSAVLTDRSCAAQAFGSVGELTKALRPWASTGTTTPNPPSVRRQHRRSSTRCPEGSTGDHRQGAQGTGRPPPGHVRDGSLGRLWWCGEARTNAPRMTART